MEVKQPANVLSREEISEFCCEHFNKTENENFEVINFKFISIEGTPKGFLGNHCYLEVLINRQTKTGRIQNKLKFFVKSIPSNVAAQMKYCEEFGVFKKEANVYKYLLPLLFDINKKNNRVFAPKCYLVKDEILVFENLIEQGFQTGTKNGGILDYDHLLCVLKSLAIMHSSSIVLEHQTKKSIPEMFGACVEENSYPDDPKNLRSVLFNNAAAALAELLKSIPKYQNFPDKNHLVKSFQNILRKIFELCKPSKKFRNVFCHGDLWANNIMFNYDKVQNIPVDCRIVDFQLARYSPPILDVITVLFIPTTSKFRQDHLDNLLKEYYRFLSQNLAEHNIDIKQVLPITEYYASIKHYKLAGLIESCLFSHLTILPENMVSNLLQDSENFDEFLRKYRNQICLKAFKNSKVYQERMTDMISDLVDNYIINEYKNSLI